MLVRDIQTVRNRHKIKHQRMQCCHLFLINVDALHESRFVRLTHENELQKTDTCFLLFTC